LFSHTAKCDFLCFQQLPRFVPAILHIFFGLAGITRTTTLMGVQVEKPTAVAPAKTRPSVASEHNGFPLARE
jgi:hypothetical protein